MNKTVVVAASVSVLTSALTVGISAFADGNRTTDSVPRVMPYQGYLSDGRDALNGPVTLTLAIYDGAGATTPSYLQTFNTNAYQGRFQVLIGPNGQNTGGGSVALQDVIAAADDLYLGVSVNGTALTGRQRLTPNAYALWAAEATDFRVNRNLDVAGATTLRGGLTVTGDRLSASANAQLGVSTEFVFRDTGDSWLRLNNGAGSTTYADLAVGNQWVGNTLEVQGNITANGNSHGSCYWTGWAYPGNPVGSSTPETCTGCLSNVCGDGYYIVETRVGHNGGDGNYWTGLRVGSRCCRL